MKAILGLLLLGILTLLVACGEGAIQSAEPQEQQDEYQHQDTYLDVHQDVHLDMHPDAHLDEHLDGHSKAHPDAHVGEVAHPHEHQHLELVSQGPLPGRSVYHLADTWLSHRGEELRLADLRGRPVVAIMFYASCESACPLLIRDALRLQDSLPEEAARATRFLIITIDPERDAPERLARYVADNELEAPNWHFISGEPHQTRALAALLGVQYRPVGNGMFSHTNLVTVLDRDGVVALSTEGLNQPVGPAVEVIGDLLGAQQR